MELNEIKKLLYKTSPVAFVQEISKNGIKYVCEFPTEDIQMFLVFLVPLSDIGDAKFLDEMESKFLIRWLIKY